MDRNARRGDLAANVAFVICCAALAAVGVLRMRGAPPGHVARENVLARGAPNPFVLPAAWDGRAVLCVFVSGNCRVCAESLPFYRRLAGRAAAAPGAVTLMFVSMDPAEETQQYLRSAGIAGVSVAAVPRPAGIPGTPSIVWLDRDHHVAGSWVGGVSPRQEKDLERLVTSQ
jgi:hypothetical protein